MDIRKYWRTLRGDNRGSGMVTVIVVTLFISILATTMLYITVVNFESKQIDYQNKQSFYEAEKTLDAIRAILANDVSDACEYAYKTVMLDMLNTRDNIAGRTTEYKEAYKKYLLELWSDRAPDGNYCAALKKLVEEKTEESATTPAFGTDCSQWIIDDDGTDNVTITYNDAEARLIIRNIKVWYTEDGYTSYIKTDIGLNLPLDVSGTGDIWDSGKISKVEMMDRYVIYINWNKY